MNIEDVALALKELGHTTRLRIFKRLVKAGEQGLAVGMLQKDLDIAPSTLSHHISALVSAGLIQQKREGRVLRCIAQYEILDSIIEFLKENCCAD